jgi:hypothetical protein
MMISSAFFRTRHLLTGIFCYAGALVHAANEPFPDIRFGPYVFNEMQAGISPVADDRVLPFGSYRLQVGWIEPITIGASYASCTFIETDAHVDVSPYQTDVGTTFSVKPFRLFELGITYNRLLFNGSMVGYNLLAGNGLPPAQDWSAGRILSNQPGKANGADIFTFQAALHLKVSAVSAYLAASRALWDIDVSDKELVYEYESDLLIKKRDRIHKVTGELHLALPTWEWLKPFSLQGLFLQNRYWYTTQTRLEKNLVSFGLAGFRHGTNTPFQKRGIDISLGYFTANPQLDQAEPWQRLYISTDWKWTVDFLSAQHF